jgi:hypothetical protein
MISSKASGEGEPAIPGTGNLVYSVIAVYVPCSVLFCFLPLVEKLLSRLLPLPPIPPAAVFVPVILCAAAASFYVEIMRRLRTDHSAADIRGAFLVMAAAYLIASILRVRPSLSPNLIQGFFRGFFPGIANILAVFTGLYLWYFVLYLRELFKARELFESHTRQYEGAELQRVMLEDSEIMSTADDRIGHMIRLYAFQLFVVGALAAACSALKIRLSPPFFVLLLLLYVNAAFIFALLRLFKAEQYFAGEGIAVAAPERSRRLASMLIFSVAAAILAALGSVEGGMLPLSLVTGFFRWLFSLLERQSPPLEGETFIPQNLMTQRNPSMDLQELLGLEETGPWPFWDYLRRFLIVLVVLGFVWFMVKPLISRSWGPGGLPLSKRIAGIFRGWLSGFLRGLAWFFSSLKKQDNSTSIGRSGARVRDMTENILAAYSRAKRRDIREGAALFARLILWGSENLQVSWKASLGPGEYCGSLSRAVLLRQETGDGKTISTAILRSGELFEEILYSYRSPSAEARREFTALIKSIVEG